MLGKTKIRWDRTLLSAASLVLWCQAAGQFGLVIDQLIFPGFTAGEIYPAGWGLMICSACLITEKHISIRQLLRPTARVFRGLIDCWPEWITLSIILVVFGWAGIEREMFFTLAVGVLCEEAVFRMMFCTVCLRTDNTLNPKTIIFVSSVLWGCGHLLNVLAGTPLIAAVWQCISAIGVGLLLGMVFLRTRSVWPMILVHFAHNLVNTAINTENIRQLTTHGGFGWNTKLVLAVWLLAWGTWLWVMWVTTEQKEVEPLWGMKYNESKEE